MLREMVILVCHAQDGRFADGDRAAVRQVLETSDQVARVLPLGSDVKQVSCADGGRLVLRAPGLDSQRSFHRIDLFPISDWTSAMAELVYDLMREGGFGLVQDLTTPQFLVTQPQQLTYYPWLPEPPILVRSASELARTLERAG
ncbi:MAG: hypothetical protein Kow00106_19260 [Anaerolineae bacterium]